MTLGHECLLSEIKPWGLGAVKSRHKGPLRGGWPRALSGLNQHLLEPPKPMSLSINIKTGFFFFFFFFLGFPGCSVGKESTCNVGDMGDTVSIPGSGRSPGVGNGNPLQYSCLENSMDRGAWRATVHRAAKSRDMTEATEHTPKHMALCTNIKTDDFAFSKILLQPFPWCRTTPPPPPPPLMGSGKNHCCSYCHFLPYLSARLSI